MKKKILHLCFSDDGGAGIAVKRIHESMKNLNVESKILVVEKNTNYDDVLCNQSKIDKILWGVKKKISRNLKYINFKTNNKNTHSINILRSNIKKQILNINPELIFIHWIGNEMISLKQLFEIKIQKIWVLHDMWLYCGAEHYTESKRFVHGYNISNKPSFEVGFDLNLWNWKRKKKYIKDDIIIATSNWQHNNANKSDLLKDKKIYKINLPINSNFWKPLEKQKSIDILGWDKNALNLLFGFAGYSRRHQKGLDIALRIFNNLEKISKQKITLNIFGEVDKKKVNAKNINIIGKVKNENYLKLLYSASDILLNPSRIESFGQIALEGMSCGLPIICNNDTGTKELILDTNIGFALENNDFDDYQKILDWINKIKDKNRSQLHELIKQKYSYEIVGSLYEKNIFSNYLKF